MPRVGRSMVVLGVVALLCASVMWSPSGFDALARPGDADFRVVIASSLQKIRRSGQVKDGLMGQGVQLQAARDEAESFQLVVIPKGTDLRDVTVEAPTLRSDKGTIPITWHRVGWVETAPPSYPTEYSGWWPDPLLPPARFNISGGEQQPLWFTVNVLPDARPGVYRGNVTIRHGIHSIVTPVQVKVRSFRLPRPGSLATPFGLYAFALSRWYYGNKPYRDAMPIENFRRWCELMGKYRLTPKNIAREYVSLIKKDDTYNADLASLKKTVEPLAAHYFAPNSFAMFRLPSAPTIRPGAKYKSYSTTDWANQVKTTAAEWKRLGLPGQVFIYGIDEPHRNEYSILREAYEKVKQVAPEYPIMQTIGDRDPKHLAGIVDIWCPRSHVLDSEFYRARKAAGDTLWTYIAVSPKPPYANFFVDLPATAHRVLFWQAYKHGVTGLLYWNICSWDGPPGAASGEPSFPHVPIHFADLTTYKKNKINGDGFLLYPGKDMQPLPSIRLEVIRDGIEDYEYLALLRQLVEKAKRLPPKQQPKAELLNRAEALLTVPDTITRSMTDYTSDPQVLLTRRTAVGDAIESLQGAVKP